MCVWGGLNVPALYSARMFVHGGGGANRFTTTKGGAKASPPFLLFKGIIFIGRGHLSQIQGRGLDEGGGGAINNKVRLAWPLVGVS